MRRFIVLYLKMLLCCGVFATAFVGTYLVAFHERIFPAPSQVVIYGRDGCAITSALREYLSETSVPFIYADIDNGFVSAEFTFQLDLSEARAVGLPVVLVNGRKMEQPAFEEVASLYRDALGRNGH